MTVQEEMQVMMVVMEMQTMLMLMGLQVAARRRTKTRLTHLTLIQLMTQPPTTQQMVIN